MIKITNITCQDNPPGPPAEPAGRQVEPAPPSVGRVGSTAGRIGSTVGLAAAVLLSWLAYIPRRLGDRIFIWNDTEAYWHGWQITKVRGGLGRRYRDPLFDTLATCPQCQGGGASPGEGRADTPCARCLGTGRVSNEEVC